MPKRGHGLVPNVVTPSVFPPQVFGLSQRFAQCIAGYLEHHHAQSLRILEIGVGSGIITSWILYAIDNVCPDGTDINPSAVSCATRNLRNVTAEMAPRSTVSWKVVLGDLFPSHEHIDAQKNLYDYIIWNMPFFPDRAENHAQAARSNLGYRDLQRLLREAPYRLRSAGEIILLSSSFYRPTLCRLFSQYHYERETIGRWQVKHVMGAPLPAALRFDAFADVLRHRNEPTQLLL